MSSAREETHKDQTGNQDVHWQRELWALMGFLGALIW